MRPRIRPRAGTALALALALGAAACGGGQAASTSHPASSSSATTPPAGTGFNAPTGPDATLTLGLTRQLTSLDPGEYGSLDSDDDVQATIFSALTKITPQQKLVGDLATSWKQVTHTEWVFHIRSGVRFSNGDPLTASTVAWNIKRDLTDAKLGLDTVLSPVIASASAPDPTTVDIVTKESYLDLPYTLSTVFIGDQSWIASHNPVLQPLGSGPYELVSVDLENGAVLTRNPYYYGPKPYYKNVDFKVLATEAARVSAVQSHEVDAVLLLEPDDLSEASSAGYVTGNQPSSWNMVFRLNETKPPLNNLDVRLALNYAINKAAIAKSLLGASIKPSPGQILVPGYDLDVNPKLQAYPYDPAKAKQLLAQAGYPHGFTLTLTNSTGTYMASDEIAQAVAQELNQVGIQLTITDVPFPTWVQDARSAQTAPDLLYVGYSSGYPGPAERLLIYSSTYGQSHYSDPAYDALVQDVFSATTPKQEQNYVDQATQQFYNAANVIFLWPQPLTYAIATNLAWTPRPEHWLLPQDISPKKS
jgi:peptide/nickel transport system substrate-binding protein